MPFRRQVHELVVWSFVVFLEGVEVVIWVGDFFCVGWCGRRDSDPGCLVALTQL